MPPDNKDNDRTQAFVPLAKGTLVGHYRIIEKIGAGGMGEVYLADDTGLNRAVALKFMPPRLLSDDAARTRFKREAQAAAGLKHPNIITIYEVGEFSGRPFFAMEHVEGHSLHHFAHECPLPLDRIIDLALQLAEGLNKAHQAGIAHRDIKPSNIVVDNDGRPKILDFGLAAVPGEEKLTRTGSTLGTVAYMSPEQAQGKEVDFRSDLFSFGVVLYELFAGRTPFRRDSEAATLRAIIEEPPEPLARYKAGVPDGLAALVEKLLDKDVETRYQTAAGVLADLKREKKATASHEISVNHLPPAAASSGKKIWRILVPTSALAVLILLVLVLKPWKIEIEPTQDATAAENRLAIMYFDNLADPADSLRLGEIVTSLLITDLTESEYVKVVSSQRLYDILKQLGHEGEKKIDRSVATQVAEKAKAKWMLVGNILNMEPEFIIAAQLIEVGSGNITAAQRVEGRPGDRIFTLVDQLTIEIKNDLSLPSAATMEPDPDIAEITTHSPEAYRLYLEALELFEKHYWSDARPVFLRALELDSMFVLAYYRLAVIDYYKNNPQARIHIANALKYADHGDKKARHYIKSLAARLNNDIPQAIEELQEIIEHFPEEKDPYLALGLINKYDLNKHKKALTYFEKFIELDPTHREGLNQLAYTYDALGQFERALGALNRYIEIAPNEANPYDSRGEILAMNGKLDEAIASYEQALALKSNFGRLSPGNLYMFRREYARADSLYRLMTSATDKGIRADGRLALTNILRHQGKFQEALQLLEIGIATDRMELGESAELAEKLWTRALLNDFFGDGQHVVEDVQRAMTILQETEVRNMYSGIYRAYLAACLAERGDRDGAGRLMNEITVALSESGYPDSIDYWMGLAFTASKQHQYDSAAVYWEKVNIALPQHFPNQYFLGVSYLAAGQLANAVATLEKAINNYGDGRGEWPGLGVFCHFQLGQAYEASGWTDKAITQYETFLDIWKDADPGIVEINDAKERLARLHSSP